MKIWERVSSRWRYFWATVIPSLIWRRDACEVLVAFDLSKVSFDQVRKAEDALAELGVHFDRGTGCGERHWEWDFSLEGPIQVRFKRRGKMKKLFMGQSVVKCR